MGVAASYFLLEEREKPKPTTYSERAEKRIKHPPKQKSPKQSKGMPKKTKNSKNKKK
jgi:hypothetical protein